VTRPQSVLDALADAETLRLNVPCIWCVEKYPRTLGNHFVGGQWETPCLDPLEALLSRVDDRIDRAFLQGWPSSTKKYAAQAARAAFRACPALRAAQQEEA
jgi:hypothetical protein